MNKIFVLAIFIILIFCSNSAFCGWNNSKYYYNNKIIFEFKDNKTDIYDADDKGFHLCGGFILNQHFDKRTTWWKAFMTVQVLSFVWEIKDGFISHRDLPLLGGNGFSYKDHLAVTIGQLGQYLFDHVLYNRSPMEGDKVAKKIQNKSLYVQLKNNNTSD